jgi:hypothetical protein
MVLITGGGACWILSHLEKRDSMEKKCCCAFSNRKVVVIYIMNKLRGGFFILYSKVRARML